MLKSEAKKKIIIAAALLGLSAAVAAGGSLAYFTDSQKVDNTFTMGDLDIILTEPSWDPEKAKELSPGSVVEKDPTVKEIEGNSYMRIVMKITDENGNTITHGDDRTDDLLTVPSDPNSRDRLDNILSTIVYDTSVTTSQKLTLLQIDGKPSVNPSFELDIARSSAASPKGGIYYYNYKNGSAGDIFKKGESAVLFTDIMIPSDWNQNIITKIGEFNITLEAQAIQSEGFADSEEAFDALGNEIENNTVQKNYGQTGGSPAAP